MIVVGDKLISLVKLRQMAGVPPSRSASTSSRPSFSPKTGLDRQSSFASRKASEAGASPVRGAPPPAYTSSPSSGDIKKKAPPPPPPLKAKPSYGAAKVYCTAIFDFEAQVSHKILSSGIYRRS